MQVFRATPILGISPFERPDAALVVALCRAGALGVLDLGHDHDAASAALGDVARSVPAFAVRVPGGALRPLPAEVTTVVLPAAPVDARWAPRSVIVQVTSEEEARAALAAGVVALIAKGHESGGRVGEEGAYVLLQRLVGLGVPVYVQGGIGLHTAAACLAGGAAGVVLDTQLALCSDASPPAALRVAVGSMDGSETAVEDGVRLYRRPGVAPFPVGQDGALARPLAERYGTAAAIVRAVREAMTGHVRQARSLRPLAEGSPLAARLGLRYPIFQGPMTRVSDRAGFADAVSGAGGLPFLALALMRGSEVRELLAKTATRLAGRTWGAGILGFVPPELREEQLAAIQAVRPPVVLIAGGRPSQARPLEAVGIATYLHVPSPGLLDLFLKDGARRFIFEGRECGGHVGPRTSFVLWESQIARLLQHEAPEELEVLFAGGIHDGRSAAMIAAMAAPLAARGARIGVLMGTAYLFTEEAVTTGAIQPAFQQAAMACDGTVLLETAPGHATRCVETDYVRAFRAEKTRLEASGLGAQEVWAALEQLNLGRLRLAAKGVRREGDALVAVDDETQRREGMVMIGQVAALRSRVCTLAELHRDVCEGATAVLEAVDLPTAAAPPVPPPAEVAIVGMACIFPGAPDLATFASNVVLGKNSITEVPRERWDPAIYYDAASMSGEKTPSKWGGFLDDVTFDPVKYGIPPKSLAAIEPVQLLALEVARRALDDAGYEHRDFDRERASVIFGAEAGTDLAGAYGFRALWPTIAGDLPPELDAALPRLTEDSFPGVLANVIAGRIANRLDFGGVNYTVDAACASSLAAVDLAIKELTGGTSDLVVCGGADLHNSINDYLMFASVHALSPSGQCRTFDASADGIVLGEGVAALVLKRLSDAERDGDRVYAVIKGVAGSSDGKSLGLTAPRREGQIRALDRAYRQSGVSPAEVGLVEAHGTGTVVGDRTELKTLADVYGRAGAAPGSCALGSVKSQIGHTKCAAGLAGLIKVSLALHHRVLPPTLNVKTPNPAWDPSSSPFSLSDTARPWPGSHRKAAVSAFGFGGTNFHVVLAEPDAASHGAGLAFTSELFLFRGADRSAALKRIDALERRLGEAWRLAELACATSNGEGPVQVAVVASDVEDLRAKLVKARAFTADASGVFVASGEPAGKVAFLFPGQGSQRVGMLGDVFMAFPELQRLLRLGAPWAGTIFPPAAWTPEAKAAQKAAITDTRVAQPALGIVDLAMATLLRSLGVRPDMLAGHSYGELVALTVAGALSEPELLRLSEARAQAILAAAGDDPGTMAAVSADPAAVAPHLSGLDRLVIANENAPGQTVISGPTASVAAALERLQAAGLAARTIPVACAFHSPVVAGGSDLFAASLAATPFAAPALPVYSNATGGTYPAEEGAIRQMLAEHIARPVRFSREIEAMVEAGARTFVEVGPGRVLTGLASKILRGRPHVAIATDQAGEPGVTQLLLALGELAALGVAIDVRPLFAGRDLVRFDLERAAPRTTPATAWLINGFRARPAQGELLAHAFRPILSPIVSLGAAKAPAVGGSRDQVVLDYLKTMRELVDTQKRVMLSYLGGPVEPEHVVDVVPVPVPVPDLPVLGLQDALIALVSERTGYPVEMLGLDLDLEADLSIDSIKRIEILGALGERLGTGGGDDRDALIEQLAAVKTLRGILAWIEQRAAVPATPGEPLKALPAHVATPERVDRYTLAVSPAEPAVANGHSIDGKRFAITDDGRGIASLLAGRLTSFGATVRVVLPDEAVGDVDGLVELSPLRQAPSPGDLKDVFGRVRDAVLGGATWVLGASGLGGGFGRDRNGHAGHGGVSGLLKSVSKEFEGRNIRAVDLAPDEDPERLADHLFTELMAGDDHREVGYLDGQRRVLRLVSAERGTDASLGLERDSVVLITGGARGITARVAEALAGRYRCRLELVGRSPLPEGDEDPTLAGAADLPALRRALIARTPTLEPAAIEAACARIVAEREIRATLVALRETGAEVVYHAIDVRDDAAFGGLIDAVYARHGRLDVVIHGAGIIEDKLLKQKTPESFARVFDTKVAGAVTLASRVRDDVRFMAFFSSVSGAFGNRGQVDYAAANDFLDKLAHALNDRLAGRVVSINWGPWGGDGGMVSAELEREYARRGIGLIPPIGGVESFLDELVFGRSEDAQVILMRADPAALR